MIKGEVKPEDYKEKMITSAVKGTVGILKSATKTDGIKRVVITSSEIAIIPWEEFAAKEADTLFDDTYHTPLPLGPYSHVFKAYAASKVHALVASKNFMAEKKPEFDVINIMPGFVIGANELVTNQVEILMSTNAPAFAQVLGRDSGWDPAVTSTSVFVDDVAWLHVEAPNEKIAGNQSFLAVSEGEKRTVGMRRLRLFREISQEP